MSLPTEFLAGADAKLQEIFSQFEDFREGFGVEFLTVVDVYLARIGIFRRSRRSISKRFAGKSFKDFRTGSSTNPISNEF